MTKLYEDRSLHYGGRLGKLLFDHISHMEKEELHDKGDIAAELAWRDWVIENKTMEIERLRTLMDVDKLAVDLGY